MFFVFLGEVLKRAFTPTPRLTDGLQVAAASALPALANFAGVDLPPSAEGSVLAYIGLVALSLFAIRLVWAPYSMWKEQSGEIGELKLELSKPERIEAETMSRRRAEKRVKLSALLRQSQMAAFDPEPHTSQAAHVKYNNKAVAIMAESGLEYSVQETIARLLSYMNYSMLKAEVDRREEEPLIVEALRLITEHLHGRITAADLLHQWPKGIELKKQP